MMFLYFTFRSDLSELCQVLSLPPHLSVEALLEQLGAPDEEGRISLDDFVRWPQPAAQDLGN